MKILNRLLSVIKFLVILFAIFFVFLFILYHIEDKHIVIKNTNKYEKAIIVIKKQDKIAHFPKSIPKNAKKVKLYCHTSNYNGETLLLKFQADRTYIEQELKKYKFINPNGKQEKLYNFYSGNGIKPDGFIFYVIDNEANRYEYEEKFPFFNGIGIGKNSDEILYYYFVWGD